MESILVIKILIPATLAFFVGILMTPFLTNILYKHEAWKKRGGKIAMDGSEAKEFNALHGDLERHVPRM